jgi:hypothetical protein
MGRLVEEAKSSRIVHWRYYFLNYSITGWTDLDSTGTRAERIRELHEAVIPVDK